MFFRSPEQLLSEFDGSEMCFNPSVPPPKKQTKSAKSTNIGKHIFADSSFGDYCEGVSNKSHEIIEKCNFSEYVKNSNKK